MPLDVLNPFDQSLVCSLDYDEGARLEAKIAAAHSAAEGWRQVPLKERIEQVRQGLERFRASSDRIAAEVSRQMGKPITQARGEVDTVFARADHMLEIAPQVLSPEALPPVDDLHRRIEHAPLGLVFNLAAWNYPLIIPVNVIVPALAAGNCAVIKPSEFTSASTLDCHNKCPSLGLKPNNCPSAEATTTTLSPNPTPAERSNLESTCQTTLPVISSKA